MAHAGRAVKNCPESIMAFPPSRGVIAHGTTLLLPPPLWGRVAVGGREVAARECNRPPPPTPPHKGEGEEGRPADVQPPHRAGRNSTALHVFVDRPPGHDGARHAALQPCLV